MLIDAVLQDTNGRQVISIDPEATVRDASTCWSSTTSALCPSSMPQANSSASSLSATYFSVNVATPSTSTAS